MGFDFEGWATKNDLRCSDGRTIRKDAFKVNDGQTVPLVWNHQHNSPEHILGHAVLINKKDGVWAQCEFNKSPNGKNAKEAVRNGDIKALSIWANNLRESAGDVIHGVIREVSLVLAGANPGAFIESVLAHGEPMDEGDSEGIFYTGEGIFICHADVDNNEEEEEETEMTIEDVLDTLNDDQKAAVGILLKEVAGDDEEDNDVNNEEEEEETEMKHNIFSDGTLSAPVLSHDDMKQILEDAKSLGKLSDAIEQHLQEGGVIAHALNTAGMTVATGTQTYGFNDPSMLFPDYKTMNNPPDWISREMDWVTKVMSGVHHTPFSRIKSVYANITEDEARAKGYMKGNKKKEEVFTTLKRTTDPQTIYKKQKLDRDDVLDITDFDVVAWIKAEMRVMLDEEIARAILIGDGRPSDSDDKIHEIRIRPIAKDVPLFNIQVPVEVSSTATESEIAKASIRAIIKARKDYKGSGSPKFFTSEDVLTEMLLLEDGIGHRLYKTEAELATALRVSEIVPVEPMSNYKIDFGTDTGLPLIGVVVNLGDYNVGADKGGDVNMFDDFDIDYNQQKYLIETRCSGALIKPFSAMTIALKKASATGGAQVQSNKSIKE